MALALAAITVLGLALRLWSARGGLWVDEAWSAVMVERARTPLGIFLAINHDNNHHLNSLWMWLCGYGTPPMALRALSVVTGTATIAVAAAIGAQRGTAAALIAALLFAVSPMMVNYGSEARGYMPMLLAFMTMTWIVSRWLDASDARPPAWRLAALATVGLLSQLTIVFGVCALVTWVAFTLAGRHSADTARRMTIRLLLPTVVATLLVFGLVLGTAAASTTGMQVGDYATFSALALWHALTIMVAASLGGLAAPPWLVIAAMVVSVAALVQVVRARDPMAMFYLAAIVGLPVALAALRVGNTGIPRYFLLSSVALLLLLARLLSKGLAGRGARRIAAGIVLVGVTAACIRDDLTQAALRRGDPGVAIATMAARAPGGTIVLVEQLRPVAPLRMAAIAAGYRLSITGRCPAPPFLHVDLTDGAPAARSTQRCGAVYRAAAIRRRGALSGIDWVLYRRADPPEIHAESVR